MCQFCLSSNGERFINVVLDQFCCTVVKRGNLLLQMRRGCVALGGASNDQDDMWGETG